MREQMKKLHEIVRDINEPFIFTLLGEQYPDYPWCDPMLDILYLTRSGDKYISPLVEYISRNGYSQVAEKLADILHKTYGEQWKKLYSDLSIEYDVLSPYSIEQTDTPDITITETPNITRTETPNIIKTETPNVEISRELSQASQQKRTQNANDDNAVFGFNSSVPSPSSTSLEKLDEEIVADKDKNTIDETTTESGSRTIAETGSRLYSEVGTTTKKEVGTKTSVRKGNWGWATSQTMLKQDIELWRWNFILDVFDNVNKLLTLSIY